MLFCLADTELNLTALQGAQASLPCAASARAQIALIIWYKTNSEVPIYTVDLRAAGAHKHTSNTSRFRFDLDRRIFTIHNVSRGLDQGRFRCRVDYRKHRSENTFVQLNVTGKFFCFFFFFLNFKLYLKVCTKKPKKQKTKISKRGRAHLVCISNMHCTLCTFKWCNIIKLNPAKLILIQFNFNSI